MTKKWNLTILSALTAISIATPTIVQASSTENTLPTTTQVTENIQQKIELYGLKEIQSTLIGNTVTQVTYTSRDEYGLETNTNLTITTDINKNIINIVSSPSIGLNIPNQGIEEQKRKPSKPTKPTKPVKTNTVPYKLNGGTNRASFINQHAYDRHKYDPTVKSTSSKTQYGKDVDVKKLRESTMHDYDNKWSQTDLSGVTTTTYAKRFNDNISTKDTSTRDHRVIINQNNSAKSTQFPLGF
ncbi:hypothetical protein PO903_03235 [Paenibacillus sp. PK4536]|uniref:hypothetical protein n=1 Tax=Paenibacillus sp. PK4536 TaxID=3024576 RepID=UPI002358B64E|nr:hypothetical protein [Paenibacillus sp. PK4536]WIM39915.1 hypothetical protein PO903_03235 [Paenibacillus sp. PK4536]